MPGPLALPSTVSGLGGGSPTLIQLGTGESMPPGLEAKWEFNGLVLNDRSLLDTFVVTSIGGLEDPDIRDDRENNPSQHGETAFDALYGGRTLTFTGYIRCYTKNKLRDMVQALKQSFSPLDVENKLIAHTGDVSRDGYFMCKKNAPIQMTETNPVENWFRRDFMITLRASNFRFQSVIGNMVNFPLGVVDDFNSDSSDEYTSLGGDFTIVGGGVSPDTGAEVIMIRDSIGLVPHDQHVVVQYETDGTYTGSLVEVRAKVLDEDNYLFAKVSATGALTIGKCVAGVRSNLTPTWTGGSSTPARAASNYFLDLKVEGNVVTARHATSDPRLGIGGVTNSGTLILAGGDAGTFGETAQGNMGFTFDPGTLAWSIKNASFMPTNLVDETVGSLINSGSFDAQPVMTISGKISNPDVGVAESGAKLKFQDDIAAGTYLRADAINRTIVDELDINQFAKLSFDSDWVEFVPGVNSITVSGGNIEPVFQSGQWVVPQVAVLYRNTWI